MSLNPLSLLPTTLGLKGYLIVGASCLAIGTAGGYVAGVKSVVSTVTKVQAAAPAKAAAAQKTADDREDTRGRAAGAAKDARDAATGRRLAAIQAQLDRIPLSCPVNGEPVVPKAAIDALNEAAQ